MPLIAQYEGKNVGSLASIYIVLLDDVTTIPIATALEISGNISAAAFTKIEPIENGAAFTETQQESEHGPVYNYTVPITINKERKDITIALAGFVGRKCIAITIDNNDGTARIIGSIEQPARLSWGSNKARQLAAGNGYSIEISASQSHPAFYYTGTIPV